MKEVTIHFTARLMNHIFQMFDESYFSDVCTIIELKELN